MHAVSKALTVTPRHRQHAVIACGDTNAFDFRAKEAERALARLLEPLRHHHSVVDAHAAKPAPTHFFARANEPKLGHRIAVFFGRLGVDFPRRYDVVASSSQCVAASTLHTPDSDHDLVWAALSTRTNETALP